MLLIVIKDYQIHIDRGRRLNDLLEQKNNHNILFAGMSVQLRLNRYLVHPRHDTKLKRNVKFTNLGENSSS